jgi:hypothetical protein
MSTGLRSPRFWTPIETIKLVSAVSRYGRDWSTVSRKVGTKTISQCQGKVKTEVVAGRMEEPPGLIVQETWTAQEMVALVQGLDQYGRDWVAISRKVGTRTRTQCQDKIITEVFAGRMEKPSGCIVHVRWTSAETDALLQALAQHGRDWLAVSLQVGTKNIIQCMSKVEIEVKAGRIEKPSGCNVYKAWTEAETNALVQALDQHGRDWLMISHKVGTKTRRQCRQKVLVLVKAGRLGQI